MRRLALLTLTACGVNYSDDPNGGLGDPVEDVQGPSTECDGIELDGEFYPVAGATGYFVGDLVFEDDDVVTGTEVWVLYANDEWVVNGGSDCEIVWDVVGTKGDPVGCATCDYGLQLAADPIASKSTCVQGLYDAEAQSFEVNYDIRELGNGEVEVLFESGNLLATGRADGTGLVYTTDSRCHFF